MCPNCGRRPGVRVHGDLVAAIFAAHPAGCDA
jgi:hypothetical protein